MYIFDAYNIYWAFGRALPPIGMLFHVFPQMPTPNSRYNLIRSRGATAIRKTAVITSMFLNYLTVNISICERV